LKNIGEKRMGLNNGRKIKRMKREKEEESRREKQEV